MVGAHLTPQPLPDPSDLCFLLFSLGRVSKNLPCQPSLPTAQPHELPGIPEEFCLVRDGAGGARGICPWYEHSQERCQVVSKDLSTFIDLFLALPKGIVLVLPQRLSTLVSLVSDTTLPSTILRVVVFWMVCMELLPSRASVRL